MGKQTTWKDPSNRIRLVGDLNRFGIRLFGRVCDDLPDDNLFLSPSSIATTLAMTQLGAEGQTREEFETAIGYSLPEDKRRGAFRELTDATQTDGVEFHSANRLWGQSSYHFFEEFLRTTLENFGAGIALVDFKSGADTARCQINAWVAEQTANRIKELVPPGSLSNMSRLVLTSAVYFLSSWQSPFEKANTTEAEFFDAAGGTTPVEMMHQLDWFRYAEVESFKVLELPYANQNERGGNFAMTIILPNSKSGLPEVSAELVASGIQTLPHFEGRQVRVYVPRFRLESTFALKQPLQALGIQKAFSLEEADFSRMSNDPEGLFISDVLHKAFVEVDEEGTEAAAATAVIAIGGAAGTSPPVEFRADRPFIFMIRHRATGLIHFIGRFLGPQPQ